MRVTLTNAFSINMLHGSTLVDFTEISLDEAKEFISKAEEFVCAIGHADTATVVGGLLGMELSPNRLSVTLDFPQKLLVAQYTGPRLPEGATTLPEGAEIKFWKVEELRYAAV
jgi:hypothetical protein